MRKAVLLARRMWLDVRMGRCSGFPVCCIAFYSTVWKACFGRPTEHLYLKSRWRVRLITWYHRRSGEAGYVPCPLCVLSGARVRVRRCTAECGHLGESRRLIADETG